MEKGKYNILKFKLYYIIQGIGMRGFSVIPDNEKANGWIVEAMSSYSSPTILLRRYGTDNGNYQVIREEPLEVDYSLSGSKILFDLQRKAREIVGPCKRIRFSKSLYNLYISE